MARVPSKHGRDQGLDFEGFLNNLQGWELSLKDKDKKLKPQAPDKEKLKTGVVDENRMSAGKNLSVDYLGTAGKYEYSRNYDSMAGISSSLLTEESSPDAASEKELGNEYFKLKKFKQAIECYSRSIALSPTAVAYANRAMAYLKIKKFQEAEDDCTEALNLDDRYIKAYSRRAAARKELGKLKESAEDSEFALRLEPHNLEIKKQYAETKTLYEKEILQKASESLRSSVEGASVSSISLKTGVAAAQVNHTKKDGHVPVKASVSVEEIQSKSLKGDNQADLQVNGSHEDALHDSVLRNQGTRQKELKASVLQLASQAASRATAEAAKNITPPKSAYQFEVSWRGLSGDRALQVRLLKAISPNALPQIFKNALSSLVLIDIVKCIASFFDEEMDLAVKYLENLTKVPRWDMLIMCLSSTDKADIRKIWDEVFISKATPIEYAGMLDKLRSRYCPN